VLGAPVADWRAVDLAATRGRLTVDGEVRGEGVGADLLGHPFEALAWLAASPGAAAFGGLRAGQVVFLGSVTAPIWVDGPCTVVVEFDTLGRVELGPFTNDGLQAYVTEVELEQSLLGMDYLGQFRMEFADGKLILRQ